MKRILCIFMLLGGISGVTHARLNTHSIAVSARFGGITSCQMWIAMDTGSGVFGDGFSFDGMTSVQVEFYTQKRTGRSRYTPMVALRVSNSKNSPGLFEGFHYGILFGGSQYIFDSRNRDTGLGWSMLANGGFTMDMGYFDDTIEIDGIPYPNEYPLILGGEIEFKTINNFKRDVGISFGITLGYQISLKATQFDSGSADFLPGISLTSTVYDNNFILALNFGFIF